MFVIAHKSGDSIKLDLSTEKSIGKNIRDHKILPSMAPIILETIKSHLKPALILNAVLFDLELLKSLIENGIDLEIRDSFGWTPLILASRMKDCRAARILLDAGADPDNADARDWAPLVHAVDTNNLPVICMLLVSGADKDRIIHDREYEHRRYMIEYGQTIRRLGKRLLYSDWKKKSLEFKGTWEGCTALEVFENNSPVIRLVIENW